MACRPDKPACRRFTDLVRDKAIEMALLLAIAMTATGASTEAPLEISALQHAESITILPVIYPEGQTDEDRQERFDSLYGKLDEYIYKALLRKLALKGYVLDQPRGWTMPSDWNVETLKGLSPEQLAGRSPEQAEHVAFLFIESIDSTNHVVQTSANAVVSALIIERSSGQVVWQRHVEETFSEHILQIFSPFGMLLTPDKHAAIETAFGKLFDDLPEKTF